VIMMVCPLPESLFPKDMSGKSIQPHDRFEMAYDGTRVTAYFDCQLKNKGILFAYTDKEKPVAVRKFELDKIKDLKLLESAA